MTNISKLPYEMLDPRTIEDRRGLIFTAIGAASVCWEKPEGAGIFESDRASRLGEETLQRLSELDQPLLGLATTRELLQELSARIGHYRILIPGNLSDQFNYLLSGGLEDDVLNYRTVDS